MSFTHLFAFFECEKVEDPPRLTASGSSRYHREILRDSDRYPFSGPAYVIQQVPHFGAPICSTMPATLTPASAPRRRIAVALGRAPNREAHPQMGFSRSMTSESAGLFIDGRRPGFTFPPVNYTEIVCEFVHLLCGNRCAKRAPHLVDLDTPFVYRQRGLAYHHACRMAHPAIGGRKVGPPAWRKSS